MRTRSHSFKQRENSAHQVFSLVALIIFLEMMGIFYGNVYFWVITLSIYILGIVLVSFVLYFSHAMEVDGDGVEGEVLQGRGNAGSVWKLNLRTLVRWGQICHRNPIQQLLMFCFLSRVVKLMCPAGQSQREAWRENFKISKVALILNLQVFYINLR